MEVIIELEETVSLNNYKTIRTRVCLREEEGSEEDIDRMGDLARKKMRFHIRKLVKTIAPSKLSGGQASQYAYKDGRKKRED